MYYFDDDEKYRDISIMLNMMAHTVSVRNSANVPSAIPPLWPPVIPPGRPHLIAKIILDYQKVEQDEDAVMVLK